MLEEYETNWSAFYLLALGTGMAAEDIVNKYTDVWHTVIFDDSVQIDY